MKENTTKGTEVMEETRESRRDTREQKRREANSICGWRRYGGECGEEECEMKRIREWRGSEVNSIYGRRRNGRECSEEEWGGCGGCMIEDEREDLLHTQRMHRERSWRGRWARCGFVAVASVSCHN